MQLAAAAIALALCGTARAAFTPIPLTADSYNRDMVAEKSGPVPVIPGGATTASMDGGSGNTGDSWNEQGYFPQDATVGLPPAGTTISTNNHQFTFAASYTANNAIMLDATVFTNANWTPTTPKPYAALSFLTSGGNGGAQFRYTVQHQDGTTEVGITNSADWFFVNDNIAWIANGRCNVQTFSFDNYNSANPRLYSIDVALEGSASAITNIFIERTGGNAGGHTCIMAISGAVTASGPFTPILGTGYDADIVVEANAPKPWTYTSTLAPTTATMDNGNANTATTWFEQGYYALSNAFGIPPAGTTVINPTATDHRYTMPPDYTVNNSVMVDVSGPTATITFATPQALASLSFLGSAAGGASAVELDTHYQDGTTETNTITFPDWFGAAPTVWDANGRIDVGTGIFANLNSGNPRLAGLDLALHNLTSPITSIDVKFLRTDGGRVSILAVSGSATETPPAFTLQPQSVITNAGATVVLSAAASSSTTPSYQWQMGANGAFANIGGANTASLTLASVGDASEGDYRVIASNGSGSVTSVVAVLTVLSTLPVITTPTDQITAYQPNGGSSPTGQGPAFAIDGTTSKYLNFGANGGSPFAGPVGFIVVPQKGRTIASVMRLYSADDTVGGDPANYTLEGSRDSANWTLIASNLVALPDVRNAGANPLNAVTQAVVQVRFSNTNSYTSYRWSVAQVKDPNSDRMQIGEVELLGVVDTTGGYPDITSAPVSTNVYEGSPASFSVTANGTPAPSYQWQKNGANVSDGPNLSGSTTPTLTIKAAGFGDVADYTCLVSNAVQAIDSTPAHLLVVSTLPNVITPTDTITSFGDTSAGFWGVASNAVNAIDHTTYKYENGGSGFSAPAGFPPFQGPVGLVVDPTASTGGPTNTIVSALRIYTSNEHPDRDPADYTLEGSNDGGVTWRTISAGPLNLPQARTDNSAGTAIDPLITPMQEVRFDNHAAFASYRITFNNAVDDKTAPSIEFAELELLGVVVSGSSPLLGISVGSNGSLTINTTVNGTLESTTALLSGTNTVWTVVGPISGSATITPAPNTPAKFFRVVVP